MSALEKEQTKIIDECIKAAVKIKLAAYAIRSTSILKQQALERLKENIERVIEDLVALQL